MNLQKRENTGSFERKLFTGVGEFKVLSVNPTREELIKLLNISEDKQADFKDTEYLGEAEGDTKLQLVFWLEHVDTGNKFQYRINLVDKYRVSQSGNNQWANAVGDSTWANSEENLQMWFKHFTNKQKQVTGDKVVRQARQGEADLYMFMKAWLSGVDFYSPDTNILLDWKKLMRGNVSEIKELLGSELTGTVTMLAYVRIVDGEDGKKEYQQLYGKTVLPGYKMKAFRQLATSKSFKDDKAIGKLYDEVTDSEYGLDQPYVFDVLQEYQPGMYIAASDATLSSDGADY